MGIWESLPDLICKTVLILENAVAFLSPTLRSKVSLQLSSSRHSSVRYYLQTCFDSLLWGALNRKHTTQTFYSIFFIYFTFKTNSTAHFNQPRLHFQPLFSLLLLNIVFNMICAYVYSPCFICDFALTFSFVLLFKFVFIISNCFVCVSPYQPSPPPLLLCFFFYFCLTLPFNRSCPRTSCDLVMWLFHGADDVVFGDQQKVICFCSWGVCQIYLET